MQARCFTFFTVPVLQLFNCTRISLIIINGLGIILHRFFFGLILLNLSLAKIFKWIANIWFKINLLRKNAVRIFSSSIQYQMNPIRERILIIDDEYCDNITCGLALQKTAGTAGLQILGFTASCEALAFIVKEYNERPVPTRLFINLNMPDLSGWEILDALQQWPQSLTRYLAVYVLSSSTDPQIISRVRNIPIVQDYLLKPLSSHLPYLSPFFLYPFRTVEQQIA